MRAQTSSCPSRIERRWLKILSSATSTRCRWCAASFCPKWLKENAEWSSTLPRFLQSSLPATWPYTRHRRPSPTNSQLICMPNMRRLESSFSQFCLDSSPPTWQEWRRARGWRRSRKCLWIQPWRLLDSLDIPPDTSHTPFFSSAPKLCNSWRLRWAVASLLRLCLMYASDRWSEAYTHQLLNQSIALHWNQRWSEFLHLTHLSYGNGLNIFKDFII